MNALLRIGLSWLTTFLFVVVVSACYSRTNLSTGGWNYVLPESSHCNSTEWALLSLLIVFLPGVFWALSEPLGQRLGPAMEKIMYCAGSAALFVFMAFYVFGWVVFFGTGQFPAVSDLDFLAVSGGTQFFQHAAHIDPDKLVIRPLLLLVFAAGLAFLFNRGVEFLQQRLPQVWQTRLAIFLCAGMVLIPLFGYPMLMPGTAENQCSPYSPLHRATSGQQSPGPLFASVVRLINPPADPEEWFGLERSDTQHGSPLLSLAQYKALAKDGDLKRSNVLVVLVESLRPDRLAAGGATASYMPNLDALVETGRFFSNSYTQASHSNYADLCPLSSHYPLRSSSIHTYPLIPTYPRVLIYDILKSFGYDTAIISSQNENWGQMYNYLNTPTLDYFFHSESLPDVTYMPRWDSGFAHWIKGDKRAGKLDDRITIDEAVRWIDSRKEERPYFIYVNLQNSHLPYEVPADFPRRFGPDPTQLDFVLSFNNYPPERAETVKEIYSNSLAYVDSQLGRLFDHLKSKGQWDNTLIVVSGDTGQAFFEHGFSAHANMIFNEVMRVPLIIHGPGVVPGVDHRPTQHVDVPPTLLELLSLPPHPGYQGISLLEPEFDPNRYIHLMVNSPLAHQYGVVRGDEKLILDIRTQRVSFYDLGIDPDERVDLARTWSEDVANRVDPLMEELRRWWVGQVGYYQDQSIHSQYYPPLP